MKLGFRKKKTKTASEAENFIKSVPLTVFSEGDFDRNALISALPVGSEILSLHNEPFTTEKDAASEKGNEPNGKYIVFVHSDITRDAAEFFSAIAERDEDLILFKNQAGVVRGCEINDISAHILNREKHYRLSDYGCAVSAQLYRRISPYTISLPDEDFLLAAFLIAKSTVFLAYEPFIKTREVSSPSLQEIRALVHFFAEIKPQLDPPRYRYLFNIVCEHAIAVYAALTKENDKEQLRELDEFLKRENMALRVAADERAPLNFIRSLRKRDFSPSLPIRAAAAVTLFNWK